MKVAINDCGGGNSGGSTSPQTGSLTSSIDDITDSVSNPCLKAIVDILSNKSALNTQVSLTLQSTFGIYNTYNISFTEGTLTGNYINNDAITRGITNSSSSNMYVTFNSPQLSHASEEYLAETTMHEIYHALLNVYPTIATNMSQHLYMAQNYVNSEVTSLRTMYPFLSLHDAQCLVIGGYGDLQSNNPGALSNVLNAYGLTSNDVATTNNNYKTRVTGTHC